MFSRLVPWQRITVLAVIATFTLAQLPVLTPGPEAQSARVTLREGREIRARMLDDARSRSVAPGDRVRFEVAEDVEMHGLVAVKAGTVGTLAVTEVKKNGMLWGKPGQVVFGAGSIPGAGVDIPVELAGRDTFKGKSRKLTAILLTPLLVGLFLRGGQGGLDAGDPILLSIPETVQVPPVQ